MAEPGKHETAGREMDQFLYAVSHDLQEPFRKVCTFGERLAAKWRHGHTDTSDQAALQEGAPGNITVGHA